VEIADDAGSQLLVPDEKPDIQGPASGHLPWSLFLGSILLAESAWLGAVGYVLYWLSS
jgi:hypothetical protein